jgi:hypothetical protein
MAGKKSIQTEGAGGWKSGSSIFEDLLPHYQCHISSQMHPNEFSLVLSKGRKMAQLLHVPPCYRNCCTLVQ